MRRYLRRLVVDRAYGREQPLWSSFDIGTTFAGLEDSIRLSEVREKKSGIGRNRRHEDIVQFQISVDDTLSMQVCYRF